MKILHYTPKLVEGDLLADHLAALVRSTEDKATVSVVSSQKAAVEAIKASQPDIVHVHGSWRWATRSVVRIARKAGAAIILSPHAMLAPYPTRHEHRMAKALRKMLYEKRLTRSYDALLATTERERDQLLADRWHDRIGFVPNACLDATCSEQEMGKLTMAFYKKVIDTRYQELMTDGELIALQTLLHVGTLHDPSKRQLSHENILKIRALKPSEWRRLLLMADDEDITGAIQIAISAMQIDAPDIDAAVIDRFPLRHPKTKGSLPRTLIRDSRKVNEVLEEQSGELRNVLNDLVNVRHLLADGTLSLRHLAELFETIRYTDFDEDKFQQAIRELDMKNFTRRIIEVLATLLNLDEGYHPIEAKDDRTVRRYIAKITRHKAHEKVEK